MGATLTSLWAQFAALATSILLLAALSKLRFVRALWRRNVAAPFAEWIEHLLAPLHHKADRLDSRLNEVASFLDYEFKNNGGNSLRDRVDEAVAASGGAPAPWHDQ